LKEKLLQLPQYEIFIFDKRLCGKRLLRQSNVREEENSDVEKEIDDSDNNIVINNSNSKEDNEI
jgi:hypothetical protein